MTIIGDSISNKNTNTALQSSMYWGVIRRWKPEVWSGICTPTNANFPTFSAQYPAVGVAETRIRSLSAIAGERTFSHGYSRFSAAPTVDCLWFGDSWPGQTIIGSRLNASEEWRVGQWFDGVPIDASFILLRTPESIGSVRVATDRPPLSPILGDEISLSGPEQVTPVPAPRSDGAAPPSFRILAEGQFDEREIPSHLLWLTTYIRRPEVSGFRLDSLAVGGSKLRDWLSNGPFATDDRLREYLAATGAPNLFYIQLGANDGNFDVTWRENLIALIERLDALSDPVEPFFILVPPYGTDQSISHGQALAAAAIEYEIAALGVPAVPHERIGFVNLPGMLAGPIDDDLTIDAIHPTRDGADLLAGLVWEALTEEAYNPGCPPDMTGSSDPRNPAYGVPDGVTDIEDLFYFFDGFSDGDPTRADLTTSSDPQHPAFGIPDGLVNDADLEYMLAAVSTGDLRGDITGSSNPISFEYGYPDGVVDAEDFFYFLDQFFAGNLERADLSGSTDPDHPDYGVPDGLLDASDFFWYLDAFSRGCD